MKTAIRLLVLAGVVLAIGLPNVTLAQSQMSGPNGLATSPKVRAMLSQQPANVVTVNSVSPLLTYTAPPALAASPKVQNQQLSNAKSTLATPGAVLVSSSAAVPDNVAASPKVREQMESLPMRFEIAPLK